MQQASRPQGPAVVITHAVRTPIGKFMGSLSELSSADLGVHAVKGLLARSGLDPAQVGEVLVGNGRQAGGGPNVARQVSEDDNKERGGEIGMAPAGDGRLEQRI